MKYTILIDQRNLAERFPTLDLADAALLAFFSDIFSSPTMRRFNGPDGQTYVWARYDWILNQMPLLGVKSTDGLTKRLRRLRDAGLLLYAQFEGRYTCHAPGPRWDELTGIQPDSDAGEETTKTHGASKNGRPDGRVAQTGDPRSPKRDTPLYKGQAIRDNNTPLPPKGGDLLPDTPKARKEKRPSSRDHESATHYPESWQSDLPFTTALADYFRHRRESKKPATPTAAALMRKKLLAHGIEAATRALEQSAANGWTGVFPEKQGIPDPKQKPGQDEPDLKLW